MIVTASLREVRMSQISWGDMHSSYGQAYPFNVCAIPATDITTRSHFFANA